MAHLLIAGTGRAGTSALVALLNSLGLDTAADELPYFPGARAGFETTITDRRQPYVVKNPYLNDELAAALGAVVTPEEIDAVIVPIRPIDDVVASRLHVFLNGDERSAGGLWRRQRPSHQERLMLRSVHNLLLTLGRSGIPIVLLPFPEFTSDATLAWSRLRGVLTSQGVTEQTFRSQFDAVIQPALATRGRVPPSRLGYVRLDTRWAALHLARRIGKIRRVTFGSLKHRGRALLRTNNR